MATLFTKIIKGEIPSYKIYEDEHCFAFLDIRPVHLGHTLVVPKLEVDHFTEVPEAAYLAVQRAAQKIGKALLKATGAPRIGTATVGFEVPHYHLHLIPIWSVTDLNFHHAKERKPEEMKGIQEKIVTALGSV